MYVLDISDDEALPSAVAIALTVTKPNNCPEAYKMVVCPLGTLVRFLVIAPVTSMFATFSSLLVTIADKIPFMQLSERLGFAVVGSCGLVFVNADGLNATS